MSATHEAYQRWAPHYPAVAHNPLMRAEEAAMLALWPDVSGALVLDLACGTGRYTRRLAAAADGVIALDFCLPMLSRVPAAVPRVCASMDRLPFAQGRFQTVISGLAVGHALRLDTWMQEVARVLKSGGNLLYSDFHPAAARAGLTRNFRDADGSLVDVPHQYHSVASHRRAAAAAGLRIDVIQEVRVGFELNEQFAGSADFYRRRHGLPVVLVVKAVRLPG